jgi:CspA family cold shock protein
MQIEVDGRNAEVDPRWRTLIERKFAKFDRHVYRVTHARVTILHNRHHLAGDNEVQVVLSVPGRTLTVNKNAAQIPDALRAALTAAERELKTYHQGRNRFVKQPSPRPVGTIARLFKTRGYGFILTEADHEVYFHKNSLDGFPFGQLEKGMQVAFEVEEGEKGPQASRVLIAEKK